jgi:5-methyltetrahydrofolate--homocysteine methyltransferase
LAEKHPLTQAVIDGDRAAAVELTRQCLADGEEPGAIIETRLVPGMAVVGERFKCDEIFVPEMLIAANAMKASLAILEPLLAESGTRAAHKAVIGTVHGDLHDIGKNLVGMMWRGANIEVIDLGVNVSPDAFAAAAREHEPDIVGMSALLTTTMPHMRSAVAAVRATGVASRIVIGGAPVSEEFASEVQADGFAPDAGSAVDVALRLIGAA